MSLVKYGGGIVQMSGSIAGNTFARNRYGNYVRARTKPVNPRSASQTQIRSVIAHLTEIWYDTLTSDQRTAWGVYAAAIAMKNRLGETVKLSGFNHFIRSNAALDYRTYTIVADGPAITLLPEQDPDFEFAAEATPAKFTVAFDDTLGWCAEDGGYMLLQQGMPQNVTRNFFKGPWHQIAAIPGNTAVPITSPQTNILAHWVIIATQKIWMRARIARADGRLSEPFDAIAVAT